MLGLSYNLFIDPIQLRRSGIYCSIAHVHFVSRSAADILNHVCACCVCRFDGRALLETLPADQSDADATAAQKEAPASEGGAKMDSFLSFERYR
jgi:hypothetical protein